MTDQTACLVLHPNFEGSTPKPTREHKDCKVKSPYCSKDLAFDDLCTFHHNRMARHDLITCDCDAANRHIYYQGDVIGRHLFKRYYGPGAMGNFLVGDGAGIYCCVTERSTGESTMLCGSIHVCDECLHLHPGHQPADEKKDGPVKMVPAGIIALPKGDGFEVFHADFGSIESFEDAMKVYAQMLTKKDNRAGLWWKLAVNMPDAPGYTA